jgi:tetratricopeptide (TPR) repeat protein
MLRKLLFAAALFVAPSLAHADWYEAGSEHFVVYSNDSPERVKEFTERLERFDRALRKITGTPDRPISKMMRVTVFMVDDVGDIQKLAGSSSVAGFFQARSSGPMAFVPRKSNSALDAQTILMHEYGHSFMFSSWPDVVFPPWFVEGFAEFVGTASFRGEGELVLGKNPEHRRWCVGRDNYLPARELVRLKHDKLDDYQTCVLYARGWLLTHYLLLGGHAKELSEYLSAINSGKSIEEATKAFGDLNSLDGKLTSYGKRASLPSIMLTAAQVPVGEVTLRKVSAGEAAIMPARILSSRGVDEKTAPRVAETARRLAAPYPNDPAAQNELAEAEFDAKNYAAAEAAADRALAADPKSIHALLYKGMAQMELAKKNETASVGDWKQARSWFLAANKLDTEYPQPLILFYESFEAAKMKPSEGAQKGLLYAYALAPFDTGLRLQAGRVLLEQGKVKAARAAYEPVAYGPHSGSAGETAKKVVDALDSSGTEAALKIIGEADAKQKEEAAKKKKGA